MTTLGFVGLGEMGFAITERLLAAGHTVVGYNRTKSKAEPLIEAGMRWADTPREVAEAADVVFTMVFDDKALRAVTEGADGLLAGLGPGKIYLEMGTTGPDIITELGQQVAATGAHMLDAPVSGSSVTVRSGALTIMASGDKEVLEQVKPILLDIGPEVRYIGEGNLASVLKIAVNLSIPVQLAALYEGVVLAAKNGVPMETALDVMLNSAIASPMLKYRGPLAFDLPEAPLFTLAGQRKDLAMALEMGRDSNVPLVTAAASDQIMAAAGAMGLNEEELASIFKALTQMAGLDA